MRVLLLALTLLVAACATPEPSAPPDTAPAGFDVQQWLAEARALATPLEEADLEDPGLDRMKQLADTLNTVADWRRACDTYRDYETGEMIYDPIPPGEGHWIRGTFEVGDLSPTAAIVAVTCTFGAYQGGYAFVHLSEDRATVLSAPELDENGEPLEGLQSVFSTPDFSGLDEGFLATFARARGLGDCGTYTVYRLDAGELSLFLRRQRECGDDIPDPLPPPSEWPVVYTAEN